ncbi:MAG: colanic acid biosynthesis glycosyltransferase WcaL, partial [Gaiellales bacterium]
MTLLAAQEPEAPVGDGEPARGNGTTGPRVGYVLKVFPRYSETFVLNELLAHERAGWTLDVFSLRAPLEGRFHPGVAQLRSPVTYVTSGAPNARDVWEALQAMERGSGLRERDLHEILEADVADAQQALTVALAVQERGITHLHAHF